MNIYEGVEQIVMAANELEKAVERADAAQASAMMYTDTMAELYKEERTEILERCTKEKADMRKHYQKIILALAITMSLIIGGLIAGTAYVVSNFDIAFGNSLSVSANGGGDATNEDGIHINSEDTAAE